MPSDSDKQQNAPPPSSTQKKVETFSRQSALALELPFTLVGAIVVGGAFGYFLDRWLHSGPWLTLILGGLGFVAGLREVLRRLPGNSDHDGTTGK